MEFSEEEISNYGRSKSYYAKKDKALSKFRTYGETNFFGRRDRPKKEETYNSMLGRMPTIRQFTVPREVGSRMDLSSNAKLIYGFLANFPPVSRFWQREIAGICGLSISTVASSLYDLKELGLIDFKQTYYGNHRKGPLAIYRPALPKHNFIPEVSGIMRSNINNIEERIRERFYDVEA